MRHRMRSDRTVCGSNVATGNKPSQGGDIAFIAHVYADVSNPLRSFQSIECSMSEATLKELVNEFHELGQRNRARALKEERLLREQDQVSIRWFIACAPYKTSWLDYGIKL